LGPQVSTESGVLSLPTDVAVNDDVYEMCISQSVYRWKIDFIDDCTYVCLITCQCLYYSTVVLNVTSPVKAVVMILPTTVVLQMSIEVCTTALMTRSLGRFVLCLYLCCDCTCTVSLLVLWLEYRQQRIVACTQVVLVYQIMLSGLHRVCQIIWVNCYTVDLWPLTENGASWLAKSHVVCSCNPPEIIPRFLSNRLTAVNLVWKLTHSYNHTRLV